MHGSVENKSDDTKDSFYDELERIFDKVPVYLITNFLRDFNANGERYFQTENRELEFV
jgi:hypothetical protein